MHKRNVSPTIWMLISAVLVFSILLVYLNILLFKLEKEKIEAQAQSLISQSFFSVPYNTSGLESYVNEIIETDKSNVSIDTIRHNLQNVFKKYKTISRKIDTLFNEKELKIDFEWTISISKFEIRESNSTTILVDSKNERSKDLVLFGKTDIGPNAYQYQFYRIGSCHFNQINLYIDYTSIYSFIARHFKLLFLIDIILAFLFAFIIHNSIKTLLRQQEMMNVQMDWLNAVSHEFNTPLSAIQVGAQALLKLKEKTESNITNRIAEGILRQQSYLKGLVSQIMTIGISEHKNSILDMEIYPTDILFNDIINKWLLGKDKSAIVLKLNKLPDKKIITDPYLFKLAIFNILDNALKYANKKPVEIKISGKLIKKRIRIFIEDNSGGMSQTDLDNAFKKFYRGEVGHASKTRGLGLGLYLVKRIIKTHKGRCKIESEKGKGTRVIISLPIYNE